MNELHITVGSTPNTTNPSAVSKEFLENDLRMTKAALLYADKVTLCSISTSALTEVASFRDIPPSKRPDFLKFLFELLPDDPATKTFNSVLYVAKTMGLNTDELISSTLAGEGWKDMQTAIDRFIEDAGGTGLVQAIDNDLLTIHHFESPIRRVFNEAEIKKLTLEYITTVSTSVSNAETYPLFDEDTSEVIRAGIDAGIFPVKDSAVVRGKEVGLASDLLARLPVFPLASIEETLELRNELRPYLIRFRSAMIKFSEGIKKASWDKDFPFDAEQVFRREIEPAVLSIEQEVKANKFVTELVRKLSDRSFLVPSGGGIALAISNVPVPAIATIAIGALIGGGNAVYDTYKEWNKKNRELQQNNLFFYYKAKKY